MRKIVFFIGFILIQFACSTNEKVARYTYYSGGETHTMIINYIDSTYIYTINGGLGIQSIDSGIIQQWSKREIKIKSLNKPFFEVQKKEIRLKDTIKLIIKLSVEKLPYGNLELLLPDSSLIPLNLDTTYSFKVPINRFKENMLCLLHFGRKYKISKIDKINNYYFVEIKKTPEMGYYLSEKTYKLSRFGLRIKLDDLNIVLRRTND